MKNLALSKLNTNTPLLSLFRISNTTSQILQIHAQCIVTNLIADPFVASQLLQSMTSPKTHKMNHSELLFTRIHQPNTFIHNTMIHGYIQSSHPEKALKFYASMRRKGVSVDNYTYPKVLKACGMLCGLVEGEEIHGEVVKRGFLCDAFVANGLIGMYCKCGDMGCARLVFDGFEDKDLVSWNLILCGCVRNGRIKEAQKVFDEMPEKDMVSWSIMIDGYGKKNGDVVRAQALFDCMPIKDSVSYNSMIYAYTKIGELVPARQLFNEMQEKNVISWSIMIEGYSQHGNPKEALEIFMQMLCQGVRPDLISLMGGISACAQLGALDQGRWIHLFMNRTKIPVDIAVETALIDMYMKCGSFDEARRMFNSMKKRNTISYNVMIAGLGVNGFGEEALECYTQMEKENIPKDDLIFLGVLTACSHSGLVSEGIQIFESMKTDGKIEPKLEHFGCLVDLLCRAGQLKRALSVIESMAMKPNSAVWGSFLMACRTHRNVGFADIAVKRLVEMKEDDSGVYVLLSNIYADAGMWGDALRIRKLMKRKKMQKESGRSVIEVDGNMVEFVSGEICHVWSAELDSVIWSFLKMNV